MSIRPEVSRYFAATDAEAATYQLMAVGDFVLIEACKTHSRDDAVWEIKDMLEELEKTRAIFPGAKFLVVLDQNGKVVSPWFEVPGVVPTPQPLPPAYPPPYRRSDPSFLQDFLMAFGWCCVVAGIGYGLFWLMGQ